VPNTEKTLLCGFTVSVLLENKALVKFTQNYVWNIFHILNRENIDDIISCILTQLHGGLKM